MNLRHPVRYRDTAAAPGAAAGTGAGPETMTGRPLRCRACGRPITTDAERCAVDGAHEHRRVNPHGYRYHFGCFRAAPGCGRIGAPSSEHTWFSGCAWRIAVCGGCGKHLGWEFSGADRFFGLILAKLVQPAA
jgi:hypothetical protein